MPLIRHDVIKLDLTLVRPRGSRESERIVSAVLAEAEEITQQAVFTAVLGRTMPSEPRPGIRGAHLEPSDPITREWTVIVLGADVAAALLARERDGDGARGVFDFAVTQDRDVVIAAARPLIKRIVASGA